jgi:hypothetical protein
MPAKALKSMSKKLLESPQSLVQILQDGASQLQGIALSVKDTGDLKSAAVQMVDAFSKIANEFKGVVIDTQQVAVAEIGAVAASAEKKVAAATQIVSETVDQGAQAVIQTAQAAEKSVKNLAEKTKKTAKNATAKVKAQADAAVQQVAAATAQVQAEAVRAVDSVVSTATAETQKVVQKAKGNTVTVKKNSASVLDVKPKVAAVKKSVSVKPSPTSRASRATSKKKDD